MDYYQIVFNPIIVMISRKADVVII